MTNEATDGWDKDPVTVVLMDGEGWRLGRFVDCDAALTLLAVISDDPASWTEVVALWDRYRTPVVTEWANGLAIELSDRASCHQAVAQAELWLWIDFAEKRIATSRTFQRTDCDAVFGMSGDEDTPGFPLSIHLPDWWELREQIQVSQLDEPREETPEIRKTNRPFLYGPALAEFIAGQAWEIVRGQAWKESGARADGRARHAFTVQVHRDWLMTPRSELDGRIPRELLHGGAAWIEKLTESQRLRIHDGLPAVALPKDLVAFEDAPFGLVELCLYFDLCRELLGVAWSVCGDVSERPQVDSPHKLTEFLHQEMQRWLADSYEGGSSPSQSIKFDRRRVPCGSGFEVLGMEDTISSQKLDMHPNECDCPICDMMADGMFGPSFVGFDGHHLELDGEFAFSMYESREEWELEQEYWHDEERSYASSDGNDTLVSGVGAADPLGSAWPGRISDEPLPGPLGGHMTLAFLLADVIGELESVGHQKEQIRSLNRLFSQWRTSDPTDTAVAARQFNQELESVATAYPSLVAKAADLQSRIDEQTRRNDV